MKGPASAEPSMGPSEYTRSSRYQQRTPTNANTAASFTMVNAALLIPERQSAVKDTTS